MNGYQKFSPAGVHLANFNVATEARGSDWIDLAADQTTMFYTSEGRRIKRFDVGSNTQLADFAILPGGGVAFALRLLSDGGLLVADDTNIKRLNSLGAVIQTYDAAGQDSWFSLNLDPDGTSFWSGDFGTGNVYKFDIASGTQLASFNTGVGFQQLFGVTIFGEKPQGVIPAPGALLLGILGVGAVGWTRRRRDA